MIKFLVKSIVMVLMLLILIPMCRLLWNIVSNMLIKAGIYYSGTMDPWGVAALFFTGLFIFFMILLLKN